MTQTANSDLDDVRANARLLIPAVATPFVMPVMQVGLFIVVLVFASLGMSKPNSPGNDLVSPGLVANILMGVILLLGISYAVGAICGLTYLERNGNEGGKSVLVGFCSVLNAGLFLLNGFIGWAVMNNWM